MKIEIYIWRINKMTNSHIIYSKYCIDESDIEQYALDKFKENNDLSDEDNQKYEFKATIENITLKP